MKKLLLSLLVLSAPVAQAHHIWLEQDGKTVRLQFGEFTLNQRETTPGLLDKFVAPTATLVGAAGERVLKLDKTARGFVVLASMPAAGESIVAEDKAYPTWETTTDGKVSQHVWAPAARLVTNFAAQQPKLTFDIVPTGKAGQFKVTYKGQPLPKVAVHAIVPSGWTKETTSDAQGLIQFDLPWRSMYVLEAEHIDKTGGERGGKAYATATYVTSLTVNQPAGVAPLPAAPVMAPSAEH
jgi:uncharacterized GH25 family protein